MQKLTASFLLGLAVFNLIMDSIHVGFRFIDIIFVILAGLPLFINKKWIYQLFGGLVSLIGIYIFFAVFISNVKGVQQNDPESFWVYGMGYAVSLLSMGFGLLMTDIIKINLKKKLYKI
ncbi:hypothetical protein ACN9MN_10815 [Chryseobacterium sp. S-02]|uniref:hypothetical protein n=1 Tax=Chryseobacterium sp. S-02 TaxID=3404064 RepID=UPI003CF8391A